MQVLRGSIARRAGSQLVLTDEFGSAVFTAQLARRALKTPAAFNSNARTSAERLYDRDPQPGMVWDRKRGWDVHARAPPVDERFLP